MVCTVKVCTKELHGCKLYYNFIKRRLAEFVSVCQIYSMSLAPFCKGMIQSDGDGSSGLMSSIFKAVTIIWVI